MNPNINLNLSTFYPNLDKEKARFTATVLFPTPPLHEETAIICLTFYKFPFLKTLSGVDLS